MAKLKTVTTKGTRLEQLQTLAGVLAASIDNCKDCKALPQLAKQYRDTVREIEAIEGADYSDEILRFITQRKRRCSCRDSGRGTGTDQPGDRHTRV